MACRSRRASRKTHINADIATKHSSSGSGSTLLIVIMIIALLCLIGLGIVMMIMNAGGVEQFKNQVAYKIYKFKAKFRGRK